MDTDESTEASNVAIVTFTSQHAMAQAIEELKGARLQGREILVATAEITHAEVAVAARRGTSAREEDQGAGA